MSKVCYSPDQLVNTVSIPEQVLALNADALKLYGYFKVEMQEQRGDYIVLEGDEGPTIDIPAIFFVTHLNPKAIKLYGYLKKYGNRGFTMSGLKPAKTLKLLQTLAESGINLKELGV